MTEQLVFHHRYDGEKEQGLSWPRIVGIAFVIALHLAALMMLLIPAVSHYLAFWMRVTAIEPFTRSAENRTRSPGLRPLSMAGSWTL